MYLLMFGSPAFKSRLLTLNARFSVNLVAGKNTDAMPTPGFCRPPLTACRSMWFAPRKFIFDVLVNVGDALGVADEARRRKAGQIPLFEAAGSYANRGRQRRLGLCRASL
jgi:hypothetical protein